MHRRDPLVVDADDLDVIRDVIRTLELERLETEFLEALTKPDPRPLMALLLANLRNLTTFYAEIPETDVFFDEVLLKAIETRPAKVQNGHRAYMLSAKLVLQALGITG